MVVEVLEGGLWYIIPHISCQGQLGRWQGTEQKASQGTACDLGPYAVYRTGHTLTLTNRSKFLHTLTLLLLHGVNIYF